MKRFLLFLLLLPLLLPAADAVPAPKAAAAPTALSDPEQIEVLKLQRAVDQLTGQIQAARAAIFDASPKLRSANAALQMKLEDLKQKHAALGYNLDQDLNWVPEANAAPQPEPVPEDRGK